jgi:hypothetical protein
MALPSVSGAALPGRNGATLGAWWLNPRATPAASLKGLGLGASGLGVQRQECLVADSDVSLVARRRDDTAAGDRVPVNGSQDRAGMIKDRQEIIPREGPYQPALGHDHQRH